MIKRTIDELILSEAAIANFIKSLVNPDLDVIKKRNYYLQTIKDTQKVTRGKDKIILNIPELDLSFIKDASLIEKIMVYKKNQIDVTNEFSIDIKYSSIRTNFIPGKSEEYICRSTINNKQNKAGMNIAPAA